MLTIQSLEEVIPNLFVIYHPAEAEYSEADIFGDLFSLLVIMSLVTILILITTFVTSVWIWLMAISTLFLKFMQKHGGRIWNFLFNRFLDTNNKPFQAMAYVWGLFIVIIFVVASPFVFLI